MRPDQGLPPGTQPAVQDRNAWKSSQNQDHRTRPGRGSRRDRAFRPWRSLAMSMALECDFRLVSRLRVVRERRTLTARIKSILSSIARAFEHARRAAAAWARRPHARRSRPRSQRHRSRRSRRRCVRIRCTRLAGARDPQNLIRRFTPPSEAVPRMAVAWTAAAAPPAMADVVAAEAFLRTPVRHRGYQEFRSLSFKQSAREIG